MNTLEEIRQNNRQRLVKHIGHAVYRRAPNPDEALKINILIDLGKGISEILSFLREGGEENKIRTRCVNSKSSIIEYSTEDAEGGRVFFQTPLEKHFYEYISS